MKTNSVFRVAGLSSGIALALFAFGGCAGAEVGGAVEVDSGPYYGPDYGAWSYGHHWDRTHYVEREYHTPPPREEHHDHPAPHLPAAPRPPSPPNPFNHDHDHDHDHH